MPAGDKPPGLGCTVEGSATSGIDTCQAGAMCWDVDPVTLAGDQSTADVIYDGIAAANGISIDWISGSVDLVIYSRVVA